MELRDWLPMVVHQVQPWISGKDIGPGQRWALALSEELANTHFAVICLTRDNKQSPWILFEAGAVAGSREGKVIPLLYGLTPDDLNGPLAQFQSLPLDQTGVESLVKTLFLASDSSLEQSQQGKVFELLWPVLEMRLKPLSSKETPSPSIQNVTDLIESLNRGNLLRVDSSPEETKPLLDLLDFENARLSEQLTYLSAQEGMLRQQGIPFSLVVPAIEPTKRRLNQVEITLDKTLGSTFGDLDSSQVTYLHQLASQAPIDNSDIHRPFVTAPTDISKLQELGLIQSSPQGEITLHPAVAEYVTRSFGPA